MKLQKLLKKLALPVFALIVVGMLAACSSPSGGGSDSGNGGSNGNGSESVDTTPALEKDKEYGISLGSLTDQEKADLKNAIEEATGSTVSGKMTGSDIEDLKDALSEAGYTYSEENGTVTIEKKPAPSSGSVTPVSSDPLFEISDLTVSATKFEWTEGEWLLKEIEVLSNGDKEYSERKIKADSSGIKFTSIVKTVSGTIPEGVTEEQKASLLASGGTISGNHYTATRVYDAEELAKKNQGIKGKFEDYIKYSSVKTNAAKTKYYWEKISSKDNGTSIKKYYLEKKSGTSTPVILPESGSSSHSDDPTSAATPTPDTNISFIGKFEGTVSGNALGSYVTYNIYIESTDKADYYVTLYETGLEFSPYFKDKGTIVSKEGTLTRTEYQGKGTGHSLFITTYEEGEMEVTIVLTSGLNYKGPITTPKSSEENKPNNGSSTQQASGSTQQDEEMIDMLEVDSYQGIIDDYYSFWEGEDNFCFYIGEADLDKIIAFFNFSESDYDIDEIVKKLVLTASGIEKFEELTETVYAGEGESTAHSSKDYD